MQYGIGSDHACNHLSQDDTYLVLIHNLCPFEANLRCSCSNCGGDSYSDSDNGDLKGINERRGSGSERIENN
jgi:hypothetical protein